MKIKILNTITSVITQESEILTYSSNKHVQDLHTENYKMLMNKIKEKINGKTYHVHILEDST